MNWLVNTIFVSKLYCGEGLRTPMLPNKKHIMIEITAIKPLSGQSLDDVPMVAVIFFMSFPTYWSVNGRWFDSLSKSKFECKFSSAHKPTINQHYGLTLQRLYGLKSIQVPNIRSSRCYTNVDHGLTWVKENRYPIRYLIANGYRIGYRVRIGFKDPCYTKS